MAETYNEAVEKLRKIVADIENGDLDVDILSEKVKEATRLIKLCKEKLYKADEAGCVWEATCRSSLSRWKESQS